MIKIQPWSKSSSQSHHHTCGQDWEQVEGGFEVKTLLDALSTSSPDFDQDYDYHNVHDDDVDEHINDDNINPLLLNCSFKLSSISKPQRQLVDEHLGLSFYYCCH